MFKKIKASVVGISLLIICGCTTVNYTGPTYAPTSKIDIFYSKSQIKQPYRVMGTATTGTWYTYQSRHIKEVMVEKAKSVGADAILVNYIGQTPTPTARLDDGQDVHDMMNENRELVPGQFISGTNPGETQSVDVSEVSVDFLKYTKK